ncbi:UNVERIFIED_CONTAM: hypothetical protein O8I53_11095 [Campylobacter lari]
MEKDYCIVKIKGLSKYEIVGYEIDEKKTKEDEMTIPLKSITSFEIQKSRFEEPTNGKDFADIELFEKFVEMALKSTV